VATAKDRYEYVARRIGFLLEKATSPPIARFEITTLTGCGDSF
jgi:hypothetical protein